MVIVTCGFCFGYSHGIVFSPYLEINPRANESVIVSAYHITLFITISKPLSPQFFWLRAVLFYGSCKCLLCRNSHLGLHRTPGSLGRPKVFPFWSYGTFKKKSVTRGPFTITKGGTAGFCLTQRAEARMVINRKGTSDHLTSPPVRGFNRLKF